VTFDCQDEGEMFDDEEEDGDEEDEGRNEEDPDEDDKEYETGINFKVSIKKGETELILNCSSEHTLQIRDAHLVSTSTDVELKTYKGPPFENISEALGEAFLQYLEERKIDDDLSGFIQQFSMDKEQREYIHWLKALGKFVDA